MNSLRITEIFYSIQGESTTVGLPTVFIRLTGCPLRCQYCDTAYAFKGGERLSIGDILEQVSQYNARYITVTGGEPLAQQASLPMMARLCDEGYQVSIETSGALDIAGIDPRVMVVMDLKTPDSKESHRNLFTNLACLKASDQVKFVICSREDYLWSKELMTEHQLNSRCEVLFSPSWGQVNPSDLADWIVEDQLNVRFQLQLHKVLWNDEPGR